MLLHSSKGQTLIHHTLPTTGRELPSGSTVTPQPAAGLGSWFLPQVHMGAAEATHNLRPGPTQRQNKKQSGEQRTKLPIQPNHGKGTQPRHTPQAWHSHRNPACPEPAQHSTLSCLWYTLCCHDKGQGHDPSLGGCFHFS